MRVGCFRERNSCFDSGWLSYNLLELEMVLCVLMDDADEMKAFVTEISNRANSSVIDIFLCIFVLHLLILIILLKLCS